MFVSVVRQDFAIANVNLFDGEKIIENTTVVVAQGKIASVGEKTPEGIEVIDGSGKFLMPAMTNSHVHAWGAPSLLEAAKAGVVNLLDMHGMEQFQSLLASNNDKPNFARYFYAGSAATVPDGHGTQFGFEVPTLTRVDEAESFVNDRLTAGAHYIKIIVEPWKATLEHEVVKAVIDATHAKDKKAVVHISKAKDAQQVINNGADGLVHIWWDQKVSLETLKQLKKGKEVFIIPTVLTSHLALENIRKTSSEGSFLSNEEISEQVKLAYDAGIPILAGTDPPNANINYGTDLYKELILLSEAGIPNIDVLKSATSLPAHFFNLGKTGSIKKGYWADLILLSDDPSVTMTAINSVHTVWKMGSVVER